MDDVFWALIMEPFAPFIKLACFHLSWHKHQTTKQVLKNETSSQINDVEVTHCLWRPLIRKKKNVIIITKYFKGGKQ